MMSTHRQSFFAFLRVALTAPSRRERTVLVVLAVYWMVWTAYGTVSKAPQGLNADMTEIVAWSRELALGYRFIGGSPQKLGDHLKSEIAKWEALAKKGAFGELKK